MSWYHSIATFLNDALPQWRATRRTNLALLTAAILDRRTLSISVLVRAWSCRLPYSHHHRKKRLFRFLSNARFDPMAVQTALLGPICQAARLRGLTPIMIDWSDLGQGRNGLFAAVCFRRRGLPLLCWVSTTEEIDPSHNRVEEFFPAPIAASSASYHKSPAVGRPWLRTGQPDPLPGRRGGPGRRLSWSTA